MGPYLGTPNTEKDSENGSSDVCKWGATSMQGWRKSQEDAHIARTDLPGGNCFFGVFDGHGGRGTETERMERMRKRRDGAGKAFGG